MAMAQPGITFESLFNSEKFSDVTLQLGASKIPFSAHRVILGIRSPYFDDALSKPSETNKLDFTNDNPHGLWRILEYMYTGKYSDGPCKSLVSEGDDLELLRHTQVYALADKFGMEDLKTLACQKFEQQLQQLWMSDSLSDCIREVYSPSNSKNSVGTKQVLVEIVSLHKELISKQQLQDIIRQGGDFAVDLVSKIATKAPEIRPKAK